MEITYTELALDDLRGIPNGSPRRLRTKISRLEHRLRGNIKWLTDFGYDYRLRCGDYRVPFDVEGNDVARPSCAAPQRGI